VFAAPRVPTANVGDESRAGIGDHGVAHELYTKRITDREALGIAPRPSLLVGED
jgi:hypothetical protein